jgi:hypothetical protein
MGGYRVQVPTRVVTRDLLFTKGFRGRLLCRYYAYRREHIQINQVWRVFGRKLEVLHKHFLAWPK